MIAGPAGTGKSTLARLLCGDANPFLEPLGFYEESLSVESSSTEDEGMQQLLDVLPGQAHRADVRAGYYEALRDGDYAGVIFVAAYGYHSLSAERYSLLREQFGTNRKDDFRKKYLEDRLAAEIQSVDEVLDFAAKSNRRVWVLSLVGKQDLWHNRQKAVHAHYENDYAAVVRPFLAASNIRHEFAYASLIIQKLYAGREQLLFRNVAGFDHKDQISSIFRLFAYLRALHEWEEEDNGN